MTGFFAALVAIRDIIYAFVTFFKRAEKEKQKIDIKGAKDEALEEKDQQPLEEALGGGGKPSKRKYVGMLTRKAKDRQ